MTMSPTFAPDLIVEATNACDKNCLGCYAPNVLVGESARPARGVDHLSVEALEGAWPSGELVETVAVRGGEPTLNPAFAELLAALSRRARTVYVETHGGWIASGHPLLAALRACGGVAKVSLDRMHGTNADSARAMLAALADSGVKTVVAVTAPTLEAFESARERLLEGFDGEVVWQKTALSAEELVSPRIGVISAKGALTRALTHRLE